MRSTLIAAMIVNNHYIGNGAIKTVDGFAAAATKGACSGTDFIGAISLIWLA
eukprot:CAMPEP_0185725910 /NCGR_PEP_ID=MMETSP1171-20130828/2040_1 /TAXON_ID=374046 /ORGANISM="Helicotheca tamensis, Strain CCMP826" /LENGTH=51 /DNA_ID=CAMNT_0028394145 /DNA_START=14 /DNA_END=166 /DNA_ORIENTATION=-